MLAYIKGDQSWSKSWLPLAGLQIVQNNRSVLFTFKHSTIEVQFYKTKRLSKQHYNRSMTTDTFDNVKNANKVSN